MDKKKLTIAIPAYNEEVNIVNLLKSILSQKMERYILEKIIVMSDGSRDSTVKNAKQVKSKKIIIKNFSDRAGKNFRINQVFKQNKNTIVVLDADIKVIDKHFIAKLCDPILKGFDLTSCYVDYLKPKNTFEKVLGVSIDIINEVFTKQNNGNNVYTCRGVGRAFSASLAHKINFPGVAGDDAYSYFYCKKNNYKYYFVKNAKAYIRLPNNVTDHIKQSSRFQESKKTMQKLFKLIDISSEYDIPILKLLPAITKSLIKKPLLTLVYIALSKFSQFNMKKDYKNVKWEIAQSSKDLN